MCIFSFPAIALFNYYPIAFTYSEYIVYIVYSEAYTTAERRIECVTRATISRHASHNFRGRPVISSLPICRTYYPVIMPMPSIHTNGPRSWVKRKLLVDGSNK